MLSSYRIIKNLTCLNISEDAKKDFVAYTVDMIAESFKKNPDWEKIRKLEEKYQFTVLDKLDDPTLRFYDDVEEGSRRDFIDLILDEKKLRLKAKFMPEAEYDKEIELIIKKRMKYFIMMFEITKQDIEEFRGGKWKWWLALAGIGAATAVGFYGVKMFTKNKEGKNKE